MDENSHVHRPYKKLRHGQMTTPENRSATSIHLSGRWLLLARVIWGALVILILALLIASIPAFAALPQNTCLTVTCQALIPPYSMQQYQASGLSIHFVLIFTYVQSLFTLLAFLAIGTIIFWLRSREFMAFYTSFALVTFAMAFNSGTFFTLLPSWWLPTQFVSFLGGLAFGTFLYLFPNGHFVPRWTRWLVIGWIIQTGLEYFFPNSPLNDSWPVTLLFLGLLASLVIAQVYRYRRISSYGERQQTKWVVFGLSIAAGGLIVTNLLYFDNLLSIFHPGPLSDLVVGTILQVFILLIPLSLAFAVSRSRLWDIDVIINRTLVYGLLTALLALVYTGSVLLLQYLLGEMFHQENGVAIVLSTLIIVVLFQPLRGRIQTTIDRRFYRRKYDAARVMTTFSATLYNEVELSHLCEQLMTVIVETVQPTHVSLWLCPPKRAGKEDTFAANAPSSGKGRNP